MPAAAPSDPGLRPHQREAVDAITKAFTADRLERVTVVSACGTGKTRMAIGAVQHLTPQGRVLVVVPTRDLLTQTIHRWHEASGNRLMIGFTPLSQKATGLPESVARLVKDPGQLASLVADTPGPVAVFVTYSSLERLADAHHGHGLPAWDMIVVDEAHRTCMSTSEGWGIVHDNDALPALHRLYMTATPRVFTAPLPGEAPWHDLPAASMDRRDIFGPVVYRLNMAEAIERGILADYQVLMPVITDSDLHAILTTAPHRSPHHDGLRTAALHIAVLRAIAEHTLQRVLVFHNRVAAAEAFSDQLPATAAQATGPLHHAHLASFCLDGDQPLRERREILDAFRHTEGCAVLNNVRVLNEGVDIPTIDAVVFAAPRNSMVDAIQAIGRALRLPPGKGKKATLILPVYLPDGRVSENALQSSEFAALFATLQALRAHDDTFLDHIALPRRSSRGGATSLRRAYYSPPERALEIALALGLEVTLPATGSFRRGLAAATRHHTAHHTLDVAPAYTDSDGFALGDWIANQRLRRIAGRLTADQIAALDGLDMQWATPPTNIDRMLEHARAYATAHGHLAAPTSATQGGHPVGAWLAECRKKANAATLAKSHAAQLHALDPWWNPGWPLTWRRAYAHAKAHIDAGGSRDLAGSFTTADGFKLGQWLSRQRHHFDTLHVEQAKLLIDIGITPHVDSLHPEAFRTERGKAFRRGLVAASGYLAREGHLNVPRQHTETDWIGPFRLGSWIDHIRRTPNELTNEERAALDILRMASDTPKAAEEP
ncbi:DEAD/DEAH box helicase [Streptomyces tibetensis]|uniref:DEAD/DEAH box helicase n=1 Tax=Streptomyces tibetensis TaxID=2382123 RepID=UPI0033F72644